MNFVSFNSPRQLTNGRTRTRRSKHNYASNNPLLTPPLLYPGTPNGIPTVPHTLERPRQTGILWEPGPKYPPRPRQVLGEAMPTQQHRHTQPQQQQAQPQPQPQPKIAPSPAARELSVIQGFPTDTKSPAKDADALVDARIARMVRYLSSWDEAFAVADVLPSSEPNLDLGIGNMNLSEPHAPTLRPPTTIGLVDPASKVTLGSSSKPPEDSDGGVAIPQEKLEEIQTRPSPTAAMQLAELKAKIPWLVEQRTIAGAGWRPLGEYYWGNGPKAVGQ